MSSNAVQPRSACFSKKAREPSSRRRDDVGPNRVVEHRGRADLDGAAAEQEIVERMAEVGDAADAGE